MPKKKLKQDEEILLFAVKVVGTVWTAFAIALVSDVFTLFNWIRGFAEKSLWEWFA